MSGLAAQRGWEWQTLQEAQSRKLRERALSQTSEDLEEYISAFDAELQAKQERIENLESLLEIARAEKSEGVSDSTDILPSGLSDVIGPQLYEGEFSDRLRLFAKLYVENKLDQIDDRTKLFITRLLQHTETSGRAVSLVAQIKSAGRDGKQMPKLLGSLLTSLNFEKSQDGKHLKFNPPKELFGLKMEVLPSTPSDSQRGGKNRSAEVIKNFGLSELK